VKYSFKEIYLSECFLLLVSSHELHDARLIDLFVAAQRREQLHHWLVLIRRQLFWW